MAAAPRNPAARKTVKKQTAIRTRADCQGLAALKMDVKTKRVKEKNFFFQSFEFKTSVMSLASLVIQLKYSTVRRKTCV